MFTFEELCQLIGVVAQTRVGGVEVERDGVRVRIEGVPVGWTAPGLVGEPLVAPQVVASLQQVGGAPVVASGAASAGADAAGDAAGDYLVTSPIVGTFYRAPSPEAEPYVRVGDRVEKGQVLCIVEAMKLMNEIEADASGVVTRIFLENGQPVEFGQKLFAIRT